MRANTERSSLGWPLRAFLYWLPVALAITVVSGLVYVAVQQDLRQGANDPQIQMAEDAATQLEKGEAAQTAAGSKQVDMARSLAPFLIIYDDAGRVLASAAQLNGQTPTLPAGVLQAAKQSGENRITWQPQADARTAAVVIPFGGSHPGFVLAGRSLREVEKRESKLTLSVGGAWVVALLGSLVAWALALAVADRMASARKN